MICGDGDWTSGRSSGDSDSTHHNGVGVVRVEGKESEVSVQGNMPIHVASVGLCDINQIVLDYSVPLGEQRRAP